MGSARKPEILRKRFARPYGGHIVVTAPNLSGADRFFERIERWLKEQAVELELFDNNAAGASERDIADVIAASAQWSLSEEEGRLLAGCSIAYEPEPKPPVEGDKFKAGAGIELRGVSYFVSHALEPEAFRETSRGMAIMHTEASHIAEIALGTSVGKQLSVIKDSLSRYSVFHEDVLALLVANALSNEPDESGHYYVPIDAILDARELEQKKKHNKYMVGHHLEARVAVVEAVRDLRNLYVGTDPIERKHRREREWRAVLHIESFTTKRDDDGPNFQTIDEFDSKKVSGMRYRFGVWFDTVKGLQQSQPFTAPRAVLALDAQRESKAKKLGHYFIQRAYDRDPHGRIVRKIRTVFRETGISPEAGNPQRSRTRFEDALKKLVDKGVFSEWGYLDEASHPPLPAYKWLEPWLNLRIWVRLV